MKFLFSVAVATPTPLVPRLHPSLVPKLWEQRSSGFASLNCIQIYHHANNKY